MKLVIDRFEGNYAICEKEDRKTINIRISELPSGVKEGSVLICNNGQFTIDTKETDKLKAEIDNLMNDIWEK